MSKNGNCLWCNKEVGPAIKRTENVCKDCTSKRDWLLEMIRISDRPAKYVARVEQREGPEREKRNKIQVNSLPPIELEERFKRIESIVEKIAKDLGF